jgi:hypothetical protein
MQIPPCIHLINVIMVLNIDLWDWRASQAWARLCESQIPVIVVCWRLVRVIRASRTRDLTVIGGRYRLGVIVRGMCL